MSKVEGLEVKLLEILRRHSDCDDEIDQFGNIRRHTLTQGQVRSLLKQSGECVSAKTIRRALHVLLNVDPNVGCDEATTRLRRAPGSGDPEEETTYSDFYYEHPFTVDQLRFLIDLVGFAPYLTRHDKAELIDKISSLGSKHFRPRQILLPERSVRANPQLFHTISVLNEAVSRERKVELKYLQYDLRKVRTVRKNAAGEDRVHVISPYQFAMNAGNYYIVCNNDRFDTLAHYRVDRIRDARIVEDARCRPLAEVLPGQHDLDAEMERYCRQHVFMYSGGSVAAKLRIAAGLVDDMVDLFGEEVTFEADAESAVAARVHAHPEDILRFARLNLGKVEILKPDNLRKRFHDDLESALRSHPAS